MPARHSAPVRAWMTGLLLCAAFSFVSPAAHAQDSEVPPPAPLVTVAERDAKASVRAFDKALKKIGKRATVDERTRIESELLTPFVLLSSRHVARRLAEFVANDKHPMSTRLQALEGLKRHEELVADITPDLMKWLTEAAAQVWERRAKGDIGVPIDPRTGEALRDTPEAAIAMQRSRDEGALFTTAIELVLKHGKQPKRPVELLRPFVQHPCDDLVVLTLQLARDWDVRELTPDLVQLLRMYPTNASWETGAVTHISGTNASAQAAWMRLYGHPDKQRARPAVYDAVTETLSAWAERKIASPADADAWLK